MANVGKYIYIIYHTLIYIECLGAFYHPKQCFIMGKTLKDYHAFVLFDFFRVSERLKTAPTSPQT